MSEAVVSVVVLSYNRPHLLSKALASVAEQTYSAFDVTVVDNRSPKSGEVAQVLADFPQFRLIASGLNLGYTGGMNLGLKNATGEFVLLTEDDIILDRHCVAEFVGYARIHPEDRLTSGLIHEFGSRVLNCAGGVLNLAGVYRKTVFGQGEIDCGQFGELREVDYISGALVFARTDYLQRLGGFREDFFLYFEDVELCIRAAREGMRPAMVPTAVAAHFIPEPGLNQWAVEFHKNKNFLALYLLHAPARVLPEFLLRYGFLTLLRELWSSPRQAWLHICSWSYTLMRLPTLLRDRRRLTRGDR